MTEIVVNGTTVTVDDGFLSLSPQEQEATVDEIAGSLPQQSQDPALSQLNLGIADAVGGLVDLINPFDTPAVSQALGMGDTLTTGSARQGMVNGMQRFDMAGEDRAPEGIGEAFLRGSGQAAGALLPTASAAALATRAPGIAGSLADDVARSMATRGGVATEIAAGGVSGAAQEGAAQAGAPEWVQNSAAVLAPAAAFPLATSAARTAGRYTPTAYIANNVVPRVRGALAPFTESGSYDVARRQVQDLAGGPTRAEDLASRIAAPGADPFDRTPAQQTGDQNMLGLEQLAARQDAALGERLAQGMGESYRLGREGVEGMGGDVEAAQSFFANQFRTYRDELQQQGQAAIQRAEDRLQGISANRTEGDNSLVVTEEITAARNTAREREAELWGAIPRGAQVPTTRAREVAEELVADTSRFQSEDIPRVIRDMLSSEMGLGSVETFRDLHGLYSALRGVARNARAGENTNANTARIADAVAEAVLEDLGANTAENAIGRAMNEARAYSVAMHQTFDQGATGRLSTRRPAGDEATDPELALERTVGRAGTTGDVSARNLEGAAAGLNPDATPAPPNEVASAAITDFVRGRFVARAFNDVGEFTQRGAQGFINRNEVLISRYPELETEILGAVGQRVDAEGLSQRIAQRISALENTRTNPAAAFVDATTRQAITSILQARNPVQATQRLAAEARRDPSGEALEGVRAAFSTEIIENSLRVRNGTQEVSADSMIERLSDPTFRAAMGRVFEPAELRRLDRIASAMGTVNQAQSTQRSIGETLSGAEAPRWLEAAIRIGAVRLAPTSGGGAGQSLQTANIVSGRASNMLQALTADRASQLIADAITDPELFRALLTDTSSVRWEREALPRLIPYIVGGASAALVDEN